MEPREHPQPRQPVVLDAHRDGDVWAIEDDIPSPKPRYQLRRRCGCGDYPNTQSRPPRRGAVIDLRI